MKKKPKSINALMAYMRDEKGLSISGSSDKKKLRYMGYFHGYKGYRFHNNPANTYAFNSFDEVQAIYDFDMAIKTMFYPEIMFLETAFKNYVLEVILEDAESKRFANIYAKLLTDYKAYPIGSNDYKKAISAYQKYYASLDKEKQTPDLQFQFGRLYYGAGTQPDSLAITVEERKQALMSADSTFHAIAEAAPDSYLGNFWRARANSALDPETTQGLAKPFYEEVAALLESKNDPHYNSALVECYSYLGYYYLLAIENPALKAEAKANKDKSIEYWSKILAIDPANATAKRALDGIK